MVHVVDVGDGACAVFRPWPDRGIDPATVIDCGVWRAGARTAADRLLTALEGDLSNVESFVVSHFDWDHWGGLRNLRHFPAALGTLGSATLFYPSMPRRLVAGLLALLAPEGSTGSAAIDLKEAMDPLLRPGARLTMRPLDTGQGPVGLSGEEFDVLWPPQYIDQEFSRRLEGAIRAVEDLAEDLDSAGYPTLRNHLDHSMRTAGEVADGSQRVDRAQPVDDDWVEIDDGDDLPLLPCEADDDGPVFGNEDDLTAADDPRVGDDVLAVPDDLRARYRRVLRRIRTANNDLSLVLASRRGSLVAFGDISGYALREVLKSPRLAGRHFDVMLVPHHGTHPLPVGMPEVRWCVAQGGTHHLRRWQAVHPNPHASADVCWNTAERGSFFPGG